MVGRERRRGEERREREESPRRMILPPLSLTIAGLQTVPQSRYFNAGNSRWKMVHEN